MSDPIIKQKTIVGLNRPEVKLKMSENGTSQMKRILTTDIDKLLWSWKISKGTKQKWLQRPVEEKKKIIRQITAGRKVFENRMKNASYKEDHIRKCLCGGNIKDTKPEKEVRTILEMNNITYLHPYQVRDKVFDFYIPDRNLLIEVGGVYWHGKNLSENQMNDMQKRHKINDSKKNGLALAEGYNLERVWEDEINTNILLERISSYGK